MALDWRETLKLLQGQFEAAASRSSGLNHLMVEVADAERDKLSGPPWFSPINDRRPPIVNGMLRYSQWDCCASGGLPGIEPGFREVLPNEAFTEGEGERVVRDKSGTVRAVFVPMKLRRGYFCGQPSEEKARFEAIANAASVALAEATDLSSHPFASELIDIFRKPRGGVRYIFGEVPNAPPRFMSSGWHAGVLQFDDGVVIDAPISEQSPDSNSWLLLLHRLGWRRVRGSGLRASRFAWEQHTEIEFDSISHLRDDTHGQLSSVAASVSGESYYSVIGEKSAPLDIYLASAFAIQILLSRLDSPVSTRTPVDPPREVDYSNEPWKTASIPQIQGAIQDEIRREDWPRLGVIVATEIEKQAVLRKMRPMRNRRKILQVYLESNTYFVGRLGQHSVVLRMVAMGSVGRDSSQNVTGELIRSWQLLGVVMVGIAFGKDPNKQRIGNVLVAERVIAYEPMRVGEASDINRGPETMSGQILLDRFRNITGWEFLSPTKEPCGIQIGPMLSGEKLVDDLEFKTALFARYPDAIGGEMEGAGVASAASREQVEWILVKSICDWADGQKSGCHQEFAAAAAVDLVQHMLNQPGALDALLV